MLESFQKRQSAFEAKFQHDQEMIFRAHARTTKLFGLWAAEQLKFDDEEAEVYSDQIVTTDLDEKGFANIVEKVIADLPDSTEADLYAQLDRCAEQAHIEVMPEDDAESA